MSTGVLGHFEMTCLQLLDPVFILFYFIQLCWILVACGIFLAVICELLVAACGIQFPKLELNLGPLHWECGILATGPPGKSHRLSILTMAGA